MKHDTENQRTGIEGDQDLLHWKTSIVKEDHLLEAWIRTFLNIEGILDQTLGKRLMILHQNIMVGGDRGQVLQKVNISLIVRWIAVEMKN